MDRRKLVLAAMIAALVAAYFVFDLGRYLDLDFLQSQRDRLRDLFAARPIFVGVVFFATFVAVTGLCLPGAAVLTLVAGAIFGLGWGMAIASAATTLGATLSFLLARYLARNAVRRYFANTLVRLDAGVRRDGAFYLLSLRLVAVFPFFIINAVMGVTAMPLLVFAAVTQVGMLPALLVFVNAGSRLGEIESVAGILSPAVLLSFLLLGAFPFVARKIVNVLRARRQPHPPDWV